jgi:carbon-monoxide dehydrogenase catalytic subunit
MGIPCHVGVIPHIEGSQLIYDLITEAARDVFGGYFIFETDPEIAAEKLFERLEKRSWRLKIHEKAAAVSSSNANALFEG